jgi:hypothetical protein
VLNDRRHQRDERADVEREPVGATGGLLELLELAFDFLVHDPW